MPSCAVRADLCRPGAGLVVDVSAAAMRTGSLPSDADAVLWRRVLAAEVRQWNGVRWLAAVHAAGCSGLVSTAAAAATDGGWPVWAVAVVMGTTGLGAVRWANQRLRVARGLQSRLPVR